MPRDTLFQPSHTTRYGMEPVERSIEGEIKTARCRFCVYLGRERREGAGIKRNQEHAPLQLSVSHRVVSKASRFSAYGGLEVGNFALHLTSAGLLIQAERDSRNNARELEATHLMPHELVKLRHSAFVGIIVDAYRGHIAEHWSVEMIDAAEMDHRDLVAAYAREPDLKATLDKHNEKTFFNEAWDSLKGRFVKLRQLCGGLATAFPNTSSVESDFALVQWEKDNSRISLTNLSLAGVMHAKQYALMMDIAASTVA